MKYLYILLLLILNLSCRNDIIRTDENASATNSKSYFKIDDGKKIGIACYNLHLFLGPALFEDKARQKAFENYVRSSLSNIDVLYLSEVWYDSAKNEITKALKDLYPYSIHSNMVNVNQGDGLLILSKFPIQDNKFEVFNDATGWDAFAKKGFHNTLFYIPNVGNFYSIFTHTQAGKNNISIRNKQFDQIKHSIDKNGKEIPSIIVGDLNVIGDKSNEYNELIKKFNYKDSFREISIAPGYTYDNPQNILAKYFSPTGKAQERLDYILYSNGWKLSSSDLISDCNYSSSLLGKTASCSDHYGVKSIFYIESIFNVENKYIANTYNEALNKVNNLKELYGIGSSAKIIIYNGTNVYLQYDSKDSWHNSTFYNSPSYFIPPGKYSVVLATHDKGSATGVFNHMTYKFEDTKIAFGTYVPWSMTIANRVLVSFFNIESLHYLRNNGQTNSMTSINGNLVLNGKVGKGTSPLLEFMVTNKF